MNFKEIDGFKLDSSRFGKDKVLLTLREHKGEKYFDIRIFYKEMITNHKDSYYPSKKGICLPIKYLDNLEGCIKTLKDSIS